VKAVVWTAYGSPNVLQLRQVSKPVPKDDEILVRVRATTVTAGDCELRRMGNPIWIRFALRAYIGVRRPTRRTILGMEFSGDIEEIGRGVTLFQRGDRVFAATGIVAMGTCAEYVCLPETSQDGAVTTMPADISYDEAAAVPVGGLEALHFMRKAELRTGEAVLINGAGGTIGCFAVQLAKHFDVHVAAVDAGDKLAMLRSIGADDVIDYTQEDVLGSETGYDVIFDVVGRLPFTRAVRSLNRGGRYLIANPRLSTMLRGAYTSKTSRKTVYARPASPTTEDLIVLRGLIEKGKLRTVIDRTYPLEQTAEAHRYVESGHKVGNVIVTIRPQEERS